MVYLFRIFDAELSDLDEYLSTCMIVCDLLSLATQVIFPIQLRGKLFDFRLEFWEIEG